MYIAHSNNNYHGGFVCIFYNAITFNPAIPMHANEITHSRSERREHIIRGLSRWCRYL